MTGKLGKKPAVRDARTLRLERYLTGALPAPPATRAWDKGIASWGMMLNDQLGDCVCAAQGHAEQLVTANASAEVTVADADVLAVYEAVGGYVPGKPATDNGCDMLAALKYWQATGIAGHVIAAYAACPLTQEMVQTCIDLFGFCYIGFAVPNSAMQQFDAGQPWTVVADDGGIEGGHCVDLVDYDATGPTCITWDRLQKMTWEFFDKYCSQDAGEGEAYGVVTREWIEANGQAPSGLNLQQLLGDVAALTGQPTPQPASTTTALIPSWNPVKVGQYFTLNVTVAGGNPSPTGEVAFLADGSVVLQTPLIQGAAQWTPSPYLEPGTHTLLASYLGDASNAPSSSDPLTLVVAAPAPVWTPDAYTLEWLEWEADDSAYIRDAYKAGDVAGASAEQANVDANGPGIATLLAAKPHGLALRPPPVPKVQEVSR